MILPLGSSRGVALVITLGFIVLVSIIAVAMSESVRMERAAARSHLERVRATALAQTGIDTVVATLRRETVDAPRSASESVGKYDQRTRHWISAPGQLLVADPESIDQKRIARRVPLSSGAPSADLLRTPLSYPDYLRPPNLNSATLLDPKVHLITEEQLEVEGGAIKMPLRWIYLREDGSQIQNGAGEFDDRPPTNDRANPIVGRFAYWTDDESTKINYNLAWTRDPVVNKNSPSHPTKIDLRALPDMTPEIADTVHHFVTADGNYGGVQRFFNSPFDARQISEPKVLAALNQNKFNLTHYNHDPDTTYFGKQRMVLTTKASNAMGRPFLDILKSQDLDPGMVKNLDAAKLAGVVDTLVNEYFKRTDWPMVEGTGASLQSKYYAGKSERLAQLALNLIDYVRSAESERIMVEPIRAKYKAGILSGDWSDLALRGQDDTYKGITRSPHITEMGVWVDQNPMAKLPKVSGPAPAPTALYRTKFFVEIYLPKGYGIDQIDLRNPLGNGDRLFLYVWPATQSTVRHYEPAWSGRPTWMAPAAGEESFYRIYGPGDLATLPEGNVLEAIADPSKMIMKAGEYRTLVLEFYRDRSRTAAPTLNLRAAIATGVDRNNNGRLDAGFNARFDVAPLGDVGSASPLTYTLAPEGTTEGEINSAEVDDPRVNGVASDWLQAPRQSFGLLNRKSSLGKRPSNASLQQDLDAQGLVSDASLRMPFRKGSPENPNGRVRSSGELGVLHTGIEGRSRGIAGGGVPWRTLHLQPSKYPRSVVPDWAFMDLFTVPSDVPASAVAFFTPHGTATGGRINMNANPEPFSMQRVAPLAAVLLGCRKSSLDPRKVVTALEAQTLAANIYNLVLAPGTRMLPPGKQYGAIEPELVNYESPGEVVEILGVADEGEESEELVREIANLITARGSVFSIYTIGQSLKQTPDGRLLVTAEQRQHAMLERFADTKNTPDPADDEVCFRKVYFRELLP